LDLEPPKEHKFTEEQFRDLMGRVPTRLIHRDFAKVYLYSMFWSTFYTVAKYGLERVQTGPDKLFEKEEAELVLKHAQRCRDAAGDLANYVRHPW
jgi:HEPN domain-containing protein